MAAPTITTPPLMAPFFSNDSQGVLYAPWQKSYNTDTSNMSYSNNNTTNGDVGTTQGNPVISPAWMTWFNSIATLVGDGAPPIPVDAGLINQLAYYAAAGTQLSGLTTANNGLLVTSATGVPSIGNAILADITVNGVKVGKGASSVVGNTALGVEALNTITTADGNTAIGYQALKLETISGSHTAVGYRALAQQNGNTSNTAIGYETLYNSSTSYNNTAVGYRALKGTAFATGHDNTAIGLQAGEDFTTGLRNSLVGVNAGRNITTGDNNTCIGFGAGTSSSIGVSITTGDFNTCLGVGATIDIATAERCIAIGYGSKAFKATGATSATIGPGISIGSSLYMVGFRGDDTIWPSTTGAGFWRPVLNGTPYMIPLITDGAAAWPAIATTSVVITKVNGTESGNAVTASGSSGIITTSSLTTAAGGNYAITWTNTSITTTSTILLSTMGGTNTTQDIQYKVTNGSGTSTLTIYNVDPAAALNGTILIGYLVV